MCEYYIITKTILERVDSAIQLNDVVAKKISSLVVVVLCMSAFFCLTFGGI